MGWGTGNLGGGSGGLNFKVVAYATEEAMLAAAPKENTIGVITENKITGWVFSATEPAEPVEGMVWFTVGTSSAVEFNALKKNGLEVYPVSAKQYTGGAWMSVDAMSYQGGEWVEWLAYLYNNGDECINTTGGWSMEGVSWNGNNKKTIALQEDAIYLPPGSTSSTNVITTVNPVNTGECTMLKIKGKALDGTAYGFAVRLSPGKEGTTDSKLAECLFENGEETTKTIELTGIDTFYPLVCVTGTAWKGGYVYEIWME